MDTPRYDLVYITRLIDRNKKFVFIVTLVCLVVGLLLHFIRTKKYEGEAAFFVGNPLYLDRSTVFTRGDSRYVDYFANEDDIDRVIALAESDTLISTVIRNTGLDRSWKFDMNDPYQRNEAKKEFKDDIKVKRTEYTLIEISFTHKDPALASNVANEIVKQLEASYRDFYIARRRTVSASIEKTVNSLDSTIAVLTDTLAALRQASGIMAVISPARSGLVTSEIKGNGGSDMGRYVEVIQNFEAVKDQLVIDRSGYTSLINQFSTGTSEEEMKLFHHVTVAKAPVEPAGPSLWIILIASALIGLFFSVIYILLANYYKEIVVVKS